MNTAMLSKARSMFSHQSAPQHVVRHNIRKWARSVRLLGDKWLLAKPVSRKGGAACGY